MKGAKSEKQSDVNCSSKQHDPIVFFLDECLGTKIIANSLQQNGILVEIHNNHFSPGVKDEDWLTTVGKKGWIIITKDRRIKYREPEKLAVKKAKAGVFTLFGGDLKANEMATAIIKALPKIKRFISKHQPPFIAKITKGGAVSMLVDL